MVTLSFIVLALFPIVLPSVLALVGLVLLVCVPTRSFEREETALYVAEQAALWSAVRDAYNADALELGLAVVEAQHTPVPTEPTMADALFAGMAVYSRIRTSNVTVIDESRA